MIRVLAIALTAACAGDGDPAAASSSSGGDAGAGGSGDGGAGVAAPELVDWACPDGWVAEPVLAGTAEEISICAPPPLPEGCPDGTMPVVGKTSCQAIGEPCPSGDWPEGLPAGPVVYVEAGATGDGSSMASPLGSIQIAADLAPTGAIVAIAKGTYSEEVTIANDVTLWGACATGVTLDVSAGPPYTAGIDVGSSSTALVRGITVGGERAAFVSRPGSFLTLRGVRVIAATTAAIVVLGKLEAENILVADTAPDSDGIYGNAVEVVGGEAILRASVLEKSRGTNVGVWGGTLELSDVLVRDGLGQGDGSRGEGVRLEDGSVATLVRTIVADNRRLGVGLAAGSQLRLEDVVVRGTQPDASTGGLGYGIALEHGSLVTGQRVVLDGNRISNLAAFDASSVELEDATIRGGVPQEKDMRFGAGLALNGGAIGKLTRAIVADNHAIGCQAIDPVSRLELTDAVVTRTRSEQSDHGRGYGIQVHLGATAKVSRVIVRDSRTAGVLVRDAGSAAELADVTVEGTLARESDGQHGDGVAVVAASAVLDGIYAAGCARAGVLFSDSSGTMTGVVSTDNAIGLATQGNPQPTFDPATCDFAGSAAPILADGALPVVE